MIQRAGPEAVERVRAIRLRALAADPDAFGTTLAEDEARPAADWVARVRDPAAAIFLAVEDGGDAGVVFGRPYEGAPGAAGLFGLWIDPAFRRRGLAGALADALVKWARGAGFRRVLLDVADGNLPAVRFYEGRGFVPTGERGSLPPPREHVLEHQRALAL